MASFGAGMFVFPHGIVTDKQGNLYVADAEGKDGKGDVVVKFSSRGQGADDAWPSGWRATAEGYFNRPDLGRIPALDGTIVYVADGHGAGLERADRHDFARRQVAQKPGARMGKGPGP